MLQKLLTKIKKYHKINLGGILKTQHKNLICTTAAKAQLKIYIQHELSVLRQARQRINLYFSEKIYDIFITQSANKIVNKPHYVK